MFEKSLYDLIRGLRGHKGKEQEYIQNSLRECRKEIKSQDMDVKATAVLKLTYLEMFGHDMSWASFNVLEVMSSPRYLLKRVGYLGAVQSYRPDTEILMLAENLLKKDLNSPSIPTMSLPLVAIPHVISPSMANSLLSDLLPRLSHSHPSVRKKTIVTLYRLALVYPETLRPAWPKIKERLMDENEDSSVMAAVVNVVCELGWRRPQDFLPLAPRLFDLLVDGSNNWMAIKIIKLFATLTPLEPRLVKKLLPPLTTIMKTTPAMSLLYECINGIIQGGILQNAQGTTEGDEIARLCVGKLRGMLVIEGDPNLKYVALLAFNRIVELHPYLVSTHEDVVMECLDDPDISIRLRALDLAVGMVNANNLTSIVDRLMRQLRNAPEMSGTSDPMNDRGITAGIKPVADSDDEDAALSIKAAEHRSKQPPPLPEEYRANLIQRILEMCSRNTYSNITDFDWYVDILVQLVRQAPAPSTTANESSAIHVDDNGPLAGDVAYEIGCELRNVAIRVRTSRTEATRAAEFLLAIDKRDQLFPRSHNGGQGVLESLAWTVGEYANLLQNVDKTLVSLLHSTTLQLPSRTLSIFLQAVIKVFAFAIADKEQGWTTERKSVVTLLIAKITHYYEPLTIHPSLEVQERAVEYLELARLANEAVSAHKDGSDYEGFVSPPLLLTEAIPSLFTGMDLNPVARGAQRKVPVPEELDLDKPINDNLPYLLSIPDFDGTGQIDNDFDDYYHQRPQAQIYFNAEQPAADRLQTIEPEVSYQQSGSTDHVNQEVLAKRRAERLERYKDDPFYIPSQENSGTSTPLGNILRNHNGEALDVDSIPIMELDLGNDDLETRPPFSSRPDSSKRKPRRHFEILADEGIDDGQLSSSDSIYKNNNSRLAQTKAKKSLLQVDSTGLASLSLEGRKTNNPLDIERREAEELEMATAMREVERLRLEMQRKSETIAAQEPEGVVAKRKKRARMTEVVGDMNGVEERETGEGNMDMETRIKKKKKKKSKKIKNAAAPARPQEQADAEVVAKGDEEEMPEEAVVLKKKKTKRRQVTFDEDE